MEVQPLNNQNKPDYQVWIRQAGTQLLIQKLTESRDIILKQAENLASLENPNLSQEKLIYAKSLRDTLEMILDEKKLQLVKK